MTVTTEEVRKIGVKMPEPRKMQHAGEECAEEDLHSWLTNFLETKWLPSDRNEIARNS